jgi:hypothetical protein
MWLAGEDAVLLANGGASLVLVAWAPAATVHALGELSFFGHARRARPADGLLRGEMLQCSVTTG